MVVNFLTVKTIFVWALVGAIWLLVFVVGCNLSIYLATKDYIFDEIANAPAAETVLIPGAAVSEKGILSPIFIDRVDTAIALYESKT